MPAAPLALGAAAAWSLRQAMVVAFLSTPFFLWMYLANLCCTSAPFMTHSGLIPALRQASKRQDLQARLVASVMAQAPPDLQENCGFLVFCTALLKKARQLRQVLAP